MKLNTNYKYTELSKEELANHISWAASGASWIKDDYINSTIKTYLDVPGWINDAISIFEQVINEAEDNDIIVEIGTYFGQSACYMGTLIKESGKKIKFDTFDTFETLDPSMRANFHPKQFIEYRFSKENTYMPMSELVKLHLYKLGIFDYVNQIICDAKYAYKLYDDLTLKLFYIDGVNDEDSLSDLLINIWPKLKINGILAGDDIIFDGVKEGVLIFLTSLDVSEYEISYTDVSYMIRKLK
jgi:hypothetical protein